MVTDTVKLTPEMQGVINTLIASGRFANAEAVVEMALRMMLDWSIDVGPDDHDKGLAELIQEGLDDLDAGNYTKLEGETEIRDFVCKIGERVNRPFPITGSPR